MTSLALERLDQIPAEMAASLKQMLPTVQVPGYLRFLDMMFHYTRDSGARLAEAANVAEDPQLAVFFAELAQEETDHYRLAEADLATFDQTPSAAAPAQVVAFQAQWDRPVAQRDVALLGMLFALESVASHLGESVRPALGRLGLTAANARFVLVHLHADEGHGASCRAHAMRLGQSAAEPLLAGAEAAAPLWVAMHRCLVEA